MGDRGNPGRIPRVHPIPISDKGASELSQDLLSLPKVSQTLRRYDGRICSPGIHSALIWICNSVGQWTVTKSLP